MTLLALARLYGGLDSARDARIDFVCTLREVIDVLADVCRVHVMRAERVIREHVLI